MLFQIELLKVLRGQELGVLCTNEPGEEVQRLFNCEAFDVVRLRAIANNPFELIGLEVNTRNCSFVEEAFPTRDAFVAEEHGQGRRFTSTRQAQECESLAFLDSETYSVDCSFVSWILSINTGINQGSPLVFLRIWVLLFVFLDELNNFDDCRSV